MKFCFKFFLFIFFVSQPLMSAESAGKYLIKTKGLVIGDLEWKIITNQNIYKTSISLKHRSFLTIFYKFQGEYESNGKIIENNLVPEKYLQNWVTNSKKRKVEIFFKDEKIKKIILDPLEKEFARVEYKKLYKYKDPLTSFTNILLNGKPNNTIDGRRIYLLFPTKTNSGEKILVKEYKNIWADHKRNDLEYLEIFKDKKSILPKKINIKFKGYVFSLIKT